MSNANDPIVIVSAARTPMGGFQGDFTSLTAAQLGAVAIKAAVERAGIAADSVEEVIFGCVLPAGQGQAPARQAALGGGLALSAGCTTVNKMCGSGMKTVMQAFDALHARPREVIVAGGMESMTNAPYLLPKMRSGARLGHAEAKDHMFLDGLEDAYDKGRLMGTYAEDTATHYQFTREAQDAFAVESLARAKRANEDGSFADEAIVQLGEAILGGEYGSRCMLLGGLSDESKKNISASKRRATGCTSARKSSAFMQPTSPAGATGTTRGNQPQPLYQRVNRRSTAKSFHPRVRKICRASASGGGCAARFWRWTTLW